MSLKGIAKETLDILKQGRYQTPSGRWVHIAHEQQFAEENTRCYTPDELEHLLYDGDCSSDHSEPSIEVANETTQIAARRLVQDEGCDDLVLLNFASARNPGGGFLNGAKAQEEDLSRCSGLYPCQITQPQYYEANRKFQSLLYTDHIIYSPKVPWFRVRSRELMEEPFVASVITAPAPNAGQVLRRDRSAGAKIEAALRRRAGMVLAIARDNGHRTVLLGAWGCGVFRNDPEVVADAFVTWLEDSLFGGAFDRIVFAITNRSKKSNTLEVFQNRLR